MNDKLFHSLNAILGVIVAFALLGALNTPLFALALAWGVGSALKISLKFLLGASI